MRRDDLDEQPSAAAFNNGGSPKEDEDRCRWCYYQKTEDSRERLFDADIEFACGKMGQELRETLAPVFQGLLHWASNRMSTQCPEHRETA